jgi:hypothetical protein
MGLDVYFRRDIANVLRATACASEGAAGAVANLLNTTPTPDAGRVSDESVEALLLQAYRQGVRCTLVSVGLAFGLEPGRVSTQAGGVQSTTALSIAGLLWVEGQQDR